MERKRTILTEKLREWQAQCPLVQWRKQQGLTRSDLAATAGVSVNSLTNWERGTSQPRDLHRLVEITGEEEMVQQWEEWWEKRPRLR